MQDQDRCVVLRPVFGQVFGLQRLFCICTVHEMHLFCNRVRISRSRSSKVVDFGTNWKSICDFPFVINTPCFIKNCTLLFLCIKNKPLIAKLWNLAGKKICDVPVFIIQEINISLKYSLYQMTFNYVMCTARDTVQLLTRETPDFIPPSLWPPNSPNLNPVDYHVWGVLQEHVYRKNIRTLDELRQRITEEWECVSVSVLVFLQTADILKICCKIPMLSSFGNKWWFSLLT